MFALQAVKFPVFGSDMERDYSEYHARQMLKVWFNPDKP